MERKTLRKVSSWRKYSDCLCYHQRKSATACAWLYIQSTERHAGGNCVAPFYKITFMQTPPFLRLFGLNVLHHHFKPQMHMSHFMSISMHYFTVRIPIFLFLRLNCNKYRMRPKSKWQKSLHDDLKKSATVKKTGLHLVKKIGQYSANPISRICSYNKTKEMH